MKLNRVTENWVSEGDNKDTTWIFGIEFILNSILPLAYLVVLGILYQICNRKSRNNLSRLFLSSAPDASASSTSFHSSDSPQDRTLEAEHELDDPSETDLLLPRNDELPRNDIQENGYAKSRITLSFLVFSAQLFQSLYSFFMSPSYSPLPLPSQVLSFTPPLAWFIVSIVLLVAFNSAPQPYFRGHVSLYTFLSCFYIIYILGWLVTLGTWFRWSSKGHEINEHDKIRLYPVMFGLVSSLVLLGLNMTDQNQEFFERIENVWYCKSDIQEHQFEVEGGTEQVAGQETEKTNSIKPSMENFASIFELAMFSWFGNIVKTGWERCLELHDLWDLYHGDKAKTANVIFTSLRPKHPTLLSRLYHAIKSHLFIQVFTGTLGGIFSLSGPLLLNRILKFISQYAAGYKGEKEEWYMGWIYVCGLFLGACIKNLLDGQTYFRGRRIGTRVRAILTSQIYQKALRRRSQAGGGKMNSETGQFDAGATVGEILNLMQVDTTKILEFSCYTHYFVSTTCQIILCIMALYFVMGWSAIGGVFVMILMIPLNAGVATRVQKLQKNLMKSTDKRITTVSEALQGIRIIKYFSWETKFYNLISATRTQELKDLRAYLFTVAFVSVLWYAVPVSVSLTTFLSYTKIFHESLDATKVFTAIALFMSLKSPLYILPDMIIRLLEVKVSFKRIEKFLEEDEVEGAAFRGEDNPNEDMVPLDGEPTAAMFGEKCYKECKKVKVGFENAEFEWDSVDSEDAEEGISSSQLDLTLTNSEYHSQRNNGKFKLKNMNVDFPIGKLTIIVGPTGSGKSSLLSALLGEMRRIKGQAYLPRDYSTINPSTNLTYGVAYVSQQAWLQNATIRDNICFGEEFDKEKYQTVVRACALSRDLEILPGGDGTEVGERGVNLSGGQKQRISIARAAYSPAGIVLLDDCLSAVDSVVGKHIFEACITGPVMENRTRVLVTHNLGLTLSTADHVVIMRNGEILAQGSPAQIRSSIELLSELPEFQDQKQTADNKDCVTPTTAPNIASNPPNIDRLNTSSTLIDEPVPQSPVKSTSKSAQKVSKLITEEERAKGSVSWHVYYTWIRAAGGVLFCAALCLGLMIAQGLTIGQDAWLRIWSNAYSSFGEEIRSSFVHLFETSHSNIKDTSNMVFGNLISLSVPTVVTTEKEYASKNAMVKNDNRNDKEPAEVDVDFYLTVYVVISLVTVTIIMIRLTIQYLGSLRASKRLHDELLQTLLFAKIQFFDQTPIGRIINRMSKDLQTVDRDIARDFVDCLWNLFSTIAILCLVTWVTPMFMIAVFPIGLVYIYVARRYLSTSRELKRLDSLTRSPIYSQFQETLTGVSTIRAYGAEKRFIDENYRRIDTNHRAFFYLWISNRWLSVRTDFVGSLVVFLSGAFILLNLRTIDAALAGLVLAYSLNVTDSIIWVIRVHAMLEMDLNSIERIDEWAGKIDQEPPRIIESNRPPSDWPHAGNIVVQNLEVRYSPSLPPVLSDVSFDVKAGEKVGIVGRTGAGKSTLATAFFRFTEPSAGSIIIDGINIFEIGLEDLRSKVTIIPQDPVLFTGTIRTNLDIFNEHTDAELWDALRLVHLVGSGDCESPNSKKQRKPTISLDSPCCENGSNFSVGQRQLLSLCRALLRRSKVIILDEASSCIDNETDTLIQQTIRSEFHDMTILTIAHRLKTICDFDKILVLDHGNVIEFDTPWNLITKPDGLFKKMCLESGEFDLLFQMAQTTKGNS